MTRHAARHGMDRVLHVHAPILEEVRQLAETVLSLGHGQTVAGHDDDRSRVTKHHRQVLRIDRVVNRVADVAARLRRGRRSVESPELARITGARRRFRCDVVIHRAFLSNRFVIQRFGLDQIHPLLQSQVLEKCGEPTSKDGYNWYYEEQGKILVFNGNKELDHIQDAEEE